MINLDANVKFEVSPIEYPLFIINENICIHCATKGSLKTVNIFGKQESTGIRPFSHIKCEACGRIFSIRWTQINNGKVIPVAIDPNIVNEVLNMFGDKSDRENTLM
jgi:hypothetical protein